MYPELFRIPFIDRPVYGYGLMLVLSFVFGAQLMKYLARRSGFNGDTFVNATLIALIAGVIGARLSHVLEELADPRSTEFARNGKTAWENFLSMLNVSSGGLTFYGGFLLATPVLIWYAIRKRVPVLRGMDIVAPCLMIGLAFGRMGCFLNGCCYGAETDFALGVQFPYGSNAFVEQWEKGEITVPEQLTVMTAQNKLRLKSREEIRNNKELMALADAQHARPVHPTELYSVFNAVFIAVVCLAYFTLSPAPGRVFALMLMLKGITRFIMEMIRVEPAVWFKTSLNWSFSMGISVLLLAAGVAMFLVCGHIKSRNELVGRVATA